MPQWHYEKTISPKGLIMSVRWLSLIALSLNLAISSAYAQWPTVNKSALGLQGPGADQKNEQVQRAQTVPANSTPPKRIWVIDKVHEERQSSSYHGRVSHPIYDLPLDYLDHPSMSVQDKVYLAQTLVPLDFNNDDVRRLIQNKVITCTPLTCIRDGKVIGYDYRDYERLKAQLEDSPPPPVKPSGAVKVKGMWKDKYPIYDFDGDRVTSDLTGPTYVGSKVFLDPFEIVAALTPVDVADIRNKFNCSILCHVEKGAIIGYDPVAFARFKRLFEAKSQEQKAQFYAEIKKKHTDTLTQKADIDQYYAQAKAQNAWKATYNPPKISNPRTSSSVPVELIREAITGNQSTFNLTTWKEENTYVLNKDGESVHYIEYKAQWDIKKENTQYVNSGGGIDFPSPRRQTTGTIGLVKRGNSWYKVSQY